MEVIEDPVEARRRIERFLARASTRDPYGELLACGQVIRRIADPEERERLRAELRRQARADKLKVTTRSLDGVVCAVLDRSASDAERREAVALLRTAHTTAAVATDLGHQFTIVARERDEAVSRCAVCGALGHESLKAPEVELAGPLFTEPCRE